MLNNLLIQKLQKNDYNMKKAQQDQIKKTILINQMSKPIQVPIPEVIKVELPAKPQLNNILKEPEPKKITLPDNKQINLQTEYHLTENDLIKAIQRKKTVEKKLAGVSPAERAKQMREAKAQKAKQDRETKKRLAQMEKQKKQYQKDIIKRLKEKFPDDGDEDIKKSKIKSDLSDIKDILFDILELKKNKYDNIDEEQEEENEDDWEDEDNNKKTKK